MCHHEKMRYFCWCKNKEDRFDCLQPRKKMLKRRNRFLLLLSPLLAKEGVSPLKAERLVCCSPASRIVGSRVDSFFVPIRQECIAWCVAELSWFSFVAYVFSYHWKQIKVGVCVRMLYVYAGFSLEIKEHGGHIISEPWLFSRLKDAPRRAFKHASHHKLPTTFTIKYFFITCLCISSHPNPCQKDTPSKYSSQFSAPPPFSGDP